MILQLLFVGAALSASPYRPLPDEKPVMASAVCPKGKAAMGKKADGTASSTGGVANLPFAHGRSFRTLDEYLEHLRCHAAPIDQPWWREIRPGVYQHVTRMREATPQTATRAELMKRFGFSR